MSNISKFLLFAMILLIIALILGVRFNTETDKEITKRTTFVDTVRYYVPVPKDSVVIRHVTARLPRNEEKSHGKSTEKLRADYEQITSEKHHFDDILDTENTDSVDVILPITRKEYGDSTFRAVISGYMPNLESLTVYPKHEVTTITKWKPTKRWNVGIHAGYGATRHGMEPYIGIGISYNLFSF